MSGRRAGGAASCGGDMSGRRASGVASRGGDAGVAVAKAAVT